MLAYYCRLIKLPDVGNSFLVPESLVYKFFLQTYSCWSLLLFEVIRLSVNYRQLGQSVVNSLNFVDPDGTDGSC